MGAQSDHPSAEKLLSQRIHANPFPYQHLQQGVAVGLNGTDKQRHSIQGSLAQRAIA